MKVIATAVGYYGVLIEPGEIFEVPEGTKGSWFKKAEKDDGEGRQTHAKAGQSSTTTKNVDAITKSTSK